MEQTHLSSKQYSGFKNLCYSVYLKDYANSGTKAKKVLMELVDKYHFDELSKIVSNTLLFPFDVLLYQFFTDKKFNDESIALASKRFGIPTEVVKEKIQEYMEYGFIDFVNNHTIDYSNISEICFKVLLDDTSCEKNAKLS